VILGVHHEHSLFLRTRAEKISRAIDVPTLILKGVHATAPAAN